MALQQKASDHHSCCQKVRTTKSQEEEKVGKSQEEAKLTARSDFLLIYEAILIFGNTPLAHRRLKKVQ